MLNIDSTGVVLCLRSTWRPLARMHDVVDLRSQSTGFGQEGHPEAGRPTGGDVVVTKAGFAPSSWVR